VLSFFGDKGDDVPEKTSARISPFAAIETVLPILLASSQRAMIFWTDRVDSSRTRIVSGTLQIFLSAAETSDDDDTGGLVGVMYGWCRR
jgi:hypothetical protein